MARNLHHQPGATERNTNASEFLTSMSSVVASNNVGSLTTHIAPLRIASPPPVPALRAVMPRLPRDLSFEDIHRRAQELLNARPLYRPLPDMRGIRGSSAISALPRTDAPAIMTTTAAAIGRTFMPPAELRDLLSAMQPSGLPLTSRYSNFAK